MNEEPDMDHSMTRELRFQSERISILNEIISSQRSLIAAYEDENELLKEELEDILGNP